MLLPVSVESLGHSLCSYLRQPLIKCGRKYFGSHLTPQTRSWVMNDTKKCYDYPGSLRCCGCFGQAALFSLISLSLLFSLHSVCGRVSRFLKRNSVYKPSSHLLRLLLIAFTMLLFLCLSTFVSTTNSRSICLGLHKCG